MMMLFLHCGGIQNIRVVRQFYTGRSRGFCYVEFEKVESADNATKMNGKLFQDRILRVDYAHEYRSHGKNDPYKQINLQLNQYGKIVQDSIIPVNKINNKNKRNKSSKSKKTFSIRYGYSKQ